MKVPAFLDGLSRGKWNALFEELYGKDSVAAENRRYADTLRGFTDAFGDADDVVVVSTPGRTEIGGNHTDHNAGYVLAAAVNLDVLSVAKKNGDGVVRLHSQGFSPIEIDIQSLSPQPEERFTSASLVRGMLARLQALGYAIGGFDCYTTSTVPEGAGLSSSAAFEVQVGSILNHLYNNGALDDITNARAAQFAENDYFGKPCGLMDQTVCAVGGLLQIDFRDFENPLLKQVDFDFASAGHILYIVNTGANHADLNDDYTALENEMKQIAQLLGQPVLRFTSKEALFDNLAKLRQQNNDRAILRAYHYFHDNQRVLDQTAALENRDFDGFKDLIIESGLSSFMYCQNVYANAYWQQQGIPLALMIAEDCLKGKGAWRVHGGGFAGTIQAFVPDHMAADFEQRMEAVFGEGCCHRTMIRPRGTLRIDG